MEKLSQKQKIIIGIIIAVICIGIYIYTKNQNNIEISTYEDIENINQISNQKNEEKIINEPKNKIKIHIAGAVEKEGIVEIEEESRIQDAIEEAGGLKENANLIKINLAKKLEDGEKIYIPYQGEENEESVSEADESGKKETQININTAGITELTQIPGVGAATAQKIIDYRQKNGKYKTIEEIKNVSGIGEAKYEKIKEYIKIK